MITAVPSTLTISLPLVVFLCRWSYSALAFTNSFSTRPTFLPSISNIGWSQRCTPSSTLSPVVIFSAGCYPSSTSSDTSSGSIASSATETSNSYSSPSLDEQEKDDTTPRVWSEWQEWALQDNVPKFLVTIPLPQSTVVDPPQKLILWRNMVRDVAEFHGYTVPLVRSMYVKRRRNLDSEEDADVPPILPLIEQFTFEPNRGMSGIVYGFQGVADGTRITTPPLYDLHQTIQLGYVYTREEGKSGPVLAYEIGSPSQHQHEGGNSWLDILRRKRQKQVLLPTISSSSSFSETKLQEGTMLFRDENGPNNLGSLVSITAIVLGTASAANILSHHLTVNIFWV